MSDTENTQQQAEFDPDAWIDSQPEELRPLIEQFKDHHVTAVQRALEAERAEKKTLARQIKDLSAKATGSSDLEKQIQDLSSKADASTLRADFYEEAAKRSINPARFGAAFKVAQVDGLISDKGRIDWDGLKDAYPEFYVSAEKKAATSSGASNGRTETAKKKTSMNDLIRGARG